MPPRNTTPRKALSCTECTRRKLKCSQTTPCTACVDRGNADICRRRGDHGTPSTQTTRSSLRESQDGPSSGQPSPGLRLFSPSGTTEHHLDTPSLTFQTNTIVHSRSNSQTESKTGRLIDSIDPDAPVTLEFLAQNRGRVLRLGRQEDDVRSPAGGVIQFMADPIFTPEQISFILEYHNDNLTWFHNVVHLPAFREQCEQFLGSRTTPDDAWVALYYAMLSVSLYHISPSVLTAVNIENPDDFARLTYDMSLKALADADFMARHYLSSVQAICLLIYVGHNLGQSDRISVLLASAVRIAQCLGLHRIGADNPHHLDVNSDCGHTANIVDREVRKRTWWFLVRQDWLQIPFANTYTIHPSQFNTPMPANCHSNPSDMIKDGRLCMQDDETYTDCSYTAVLNHISVLIWKTQDRMYSIGHTRNTEGGLDRLYKIVLQSDTQLKKLEHELPKFFRGNASIVSDGLPAHLYHQRRALSLSIAHKFYSIHRHFQVLSYRNPWFAYSRLSCVSSAMSSLRSLLDCPDDQYIHIIRSMWTTSSQTITAANWILFELLFTKESEAFMYDRVEMKNMIEACLALLSRVQDRSRIGKNGVRLLQTLLRIDQETSADQRGEFKMEEIITSTIREEGIASAASTGIENWLPFGDSPTAFLGAMPDENFLDDGF